tara:strand:- start:109 stop:1524 length:1416 start_codon:yes stop_codon:yes gene_type:complete
MGIFDFFKKKKVVEEETTQEPKTPKQEKKKSFVEPEVSGEVEKFTNEKQIVSKKINVKISNWLGEVSFETTQELIDDFNEYYEDTFEEPLSEENNYTIDSNGMMFEEPYEQLDPNGEFVVVSEYSIYDEDWNTGYIIEFINCDCPGELEEYVFEDWIFINEYQELIECRDNKSKFSKIIEERNYEIDNNGTGCLRFSDFNYKEFLEIIGAKEPGSDKLYNDISNDDGENILNIGGGIYEKFQKKNGEIFGIKETFKKDILIKSEEFKNDILECITKEFDQDTGQLRLKYLTKNNKRILIDQYFLEWSDNEGNPYINTRFIIEGDDKIEIGFGINGRGNDFVHPSLHNIMKYYNSKNETNIDFTTDGNILFIWDGKNSISGDLGELNSNEGIKFIKDFKVFECYYPNGNKMEYREMKDGKVHGSWKRFYENGVLGYETQHSESKLDGKSVIYDNDGKIKEEIVYKNGIKGEF